MLRVQASGAAQAAGKGAHGAAHAQATRTGTNLSWSGQQSASLQQARPHASLAIATAASSALREAEPHQPEPACTKARVYSILEEWERFS